ncbi:MAG: Stk1 family PASTA domain-containing Ser/Thr kinase [Clostridiales bacterium]|nr:Stk1 family PASTA domain-containing Ser/Thr kinase [Clostridiales bacterium]
MSRLLGGRYEILEKIGEGGMSVVYKARCTFLNRFVAIKVLKPEFLEDKKFIENFRNESRAAASLTHPNIVNIYDVGMEGRNIHYIVMEYVEGETLNSIIERVERLSDMDTVHIAKQIASALSCAHKNNIIHRDVKPHNIIVTDEGVAKITDFGIARAVTNTTLVASDSILGSVHYFSPEQARGGYVDGKSDLYSLGIMMYEMVTGRVPFDGDNPITVAMMHINKEIVPPSRLNPNVSAALEKIILRATQKYQVNRFSDADEMLSALNALTPSNIPYTVSEVAVAVPGEEEPEEEVKTEDIKQSSTDTLVLDKNITEEGYENYIEETEEALENEEYIDEDIEEDYNEDPEEFYEDETPKSKKELKAEKKARKKAGKKKKRIFTLPRFLGVIFGIILAAFLSMGILWAVDYVQLPEVEVPDLIGMNYEEAEDLLETYGLMMEIESQVYSSEYEANVICVQTPDGGDKVKEGYKIRVTISKGPNDAGVPDLVGKTLEEAKRIIEEQGYQIGTVDKADDASPEGTVLEQTPKYGEEVQPGTLINLVVSNGKGQEEIEMINLIGADLDSATEMIRSANLVLNNVDYRYNDTYDAGLVIEQNIAMGEKIMTGTKINLIVSKGRNPESSSEGTTATVPLILDYTVSQNDVFEIKINLVQDGIVTLVHDQVHYKSNNGESIDITGSGKGTLLIYYDNKLVNEGVIDFGSGTFSY